jgi:hypothetical protein
MPDRLDGGPTLHEYVGVSQKATRIQGALS